MSQTFNKYYASLRRTLVLKIFIQLIKFGNQFVENGKISRHVRTCTSKKSHVRKLYVQQNIHLRLQMYKFLLKPNGC